ncbi:MAG: hypothetical protein ACLR8Y_08495 [Alistipes indistinctus]
MRGRHVQAEHIPQAYREGEREKECRQERHAAQPGNRAGVRFAGTELVEQFFLFEIITMQGNGEPSRSGGQQKVAMTSKVNSISWRWSFLTGVVSVGKGTKITDTEHSNI